jgi:recombination protein RecT
MVIKETQIAPVEPKKASASERFTALVEKEFSSGVGEIKLTEFQKRLAQNYFIVLDATLKAAESKRIVKNEKTSNEKYKELLSYSWDNLNLESLARNVVSMARIGLDPAQKNHINMIPYKNNTTKKYDIGFIEGYRGIELKAKKYGLDVPDNVIVELVYATDVFKPIKKSASNVVENYEFEIKNPFNRGEIIGGFYYHGYSANPEKNKLVIFTLSDIEKRKPQYASAEFWGGEKDKWENGKKVGTEKVEGWYEQMCHKTISRAAYSDITIDSQKIDDDYLRLKQSELAYAEAELAEEVDKEMCSEDIDISGAIDIETQPVTEGSNSQNDSPNDSSPKDGPDF